MDKVVAAIAEDQSIAAKVLQVINSSFYSVKNRFAETGGGLLRLY